jgi:thiol-disulfide isomerase/thioredoxin
LRHATELGFAIAKRNNVTDAEFVKDLSVFVLSSECTLPEEVKTKMAMQLEGVLRLNLGNDPKLYGRTLDDKEFKWDDLREKYVLIQFTATWCGPCAMEMPGMLEAYKKYNDKGFEIVSVYVWQDEADPVATVKKYTEGKELPWTIISEELSKKAKHPEYGDFYNISGVPTMVLVDKEGKIILTEARGAKLQDKLAEIFK